MTVDVFPPLPMVLCYYPCACRAMRDLRVLHQKMCGAFRVYRVFFRFFSLLLSCVRVLATISVSDCSIVYSDSRYDAVLDGQRAVLVFFGGGRCALHLRVRCRTDTTIPTGVDVLIPTNITRRLTKDCVAIKIHRTAPWK